MIIRPPSETPQDPNPDPSSAADAAAPASFSIPAAPWHLAQTEVGFQPQTLSDVWSPVRASVAFHVGGKYAMQVSSAFSTWVSAVEYTFRAHHQQVSKGSAVSRASGPKLVVRRVELVSQNISETCRISTWWPRGGPGPAPSSPRRLGIVVEPTAPPRSGPSSSAGSSS
eukprot:7579335-Pyramimonas_sp.AAC.1